MSSLGLGQERESESAACRRAASFERNKVVTPNTQFIPTGIFKPRRETGGQDEEKKCFLHKVCIIIFWFKKRNVDKEDRASFYLMLLCRNVLVALQAGWDFVPNRAHVTWCVCLVVRVCVCV